MTTRSGGYSMVASNGRTGFAPKVARIYLVLLSRVAQPHWEVEFSLAKEAARQVVRLLRRFSFQRWSRDIFSYYFQEGWPGWLNPREFLLEFNQVHPVVRDAIGVKGFHSIRD